MSATKLSADDIKRVKGLGCLQDKRFDDVFNVRVITRNGKLTRDESVLWQKLPENLAPVR